MSMQDPRALPRLMAWMLGFGVLLMAVKMGAYALTHSTAILSDALESIINVTAGAFAWYSLRLAARPRDANHPYGHGKVEFFAAGFEGGLISIAGLAIVAKAGYALWRPQSLHELTFGTLIILGAGLCNGAMGWVLLRAGRKHHSLTLTADGKHLLSDLYSSLGLTVGLILIQLTGLTWLDSAVALVMAGVILFAGYQLLRSSIAGLMDELDLKLVARVIAVLNAHRRPDWIDLHNLRLQKYGRELHLDAHLTFPYYRTLTEIDAELRHIERLMQEHFELQVELFLSVEPCMPQAQCSLCQVENCPGRQAPFAARVEWTTENTTADQPHVA